MKPKSIEYMIHTWDISPKGWNNSESSSSVHENAKFRTNNRAVCRIVSFVLSLTGSGCTTAF